MRSPPSRCSGPAWRVRQPSASMRICGRSMRGSQARAISGTRWHCKSQKIQQALDGRSVRWDRQPLDRVRRSTASAQNILQLSATVEGEMHEKSRRNEDKVATDKPMIGGYPACAIRSSPALDVPNDALEIPLGYFRRGKLVCVGIPCPPFSNLFRTARLGILCLLGSVIFLFLRRLISLPLESGCGFFGHVGGGFFVSR
jgi:hypothetical protein